MPQAPVRSRWALLALVVALAIVTTFTVALARDTAATVEVRVWQSTSDPERIYVSARAAGGSWDTLGTIPLALAAENSRGTFRYGDISLDVPLGEPAPEAAPVPESAEGINVRLSPAGSRGDAVLVHLSADHNIGYHGLQVWLETGGAWHWTSTRTAIPADEERELSAIIGYQWQDVTGVRVRTLVGNVEIREWQCQPPAADRHALDARYSCDAYTTTTAAELATAEDATLWVYLVSGRNQNVEAHARSGGELAGLKVIVFYARRADFRTPTGFMSSEFCLGELPADTAKRVGCGGYDGWNGMSPAPSLSQVAYVLVYESAAKYLRCERHEASTAKRHVWACAAW